MSASDEMMKVLQQIWSKLQAFSQDHPLMQAAFLIMVLFFLTFITMMMIGCLYGRCGCCQGTRNRVSVI
ncbi:small integral membrane protein 5 [Paramisgurnus dabryanus]|uniref:small integral membrane protein 5 n=1 Tax=Paramisgurnus dabryanus TaxID=90735 RepID=UPI0031F44625